MPKIVWEGSLKNGNTARAVVGEDGRCSIERRHKVDAMGIESWRDCNAMECREIAALLMLVLYHQQTGAIVIPNELRISRSDGYDRGSRDER